MFEIYTIIEDRIVIIAARANRRQAEEYVAAHEDSCLSTLLIRHAPEQKRYRYFDKLGAEEVLAQFQVGLMVARKDAAAGGARPGL